MSNESADAQLDQLRRVWAALGQDDPLWAVLSHADKRGGRWRVDEFLATGQIEIDSQLAALASAGFPMRRDLAIDFGCGAGRLSRALAGHFGRVIGLDVSPSMIAAARRLNADVANVEFRENRGAKLAGIEDASVDLVFSHITLQHIPTTLALGYVEEFLRVLAPGGVAMFQFVVGSDSSWRGRVFGLVPNRWLNFLRRLLWRRRDVFEMHVLHEDALRELLVRDPRMQLLAAVDDGAAGPGWQGRRWSVVNRDRPPQRVECDGYTLLVHADDLHIGAPIIAGSEHEPHVAAALRERLRPGDVVLDIGANVGNFTLLAASRVGAAGRVIAVEPIARNRDLIVRAAQLNGFAQVEVIAGAASDRPGTVDLRTHPETSNSATPAAAGERLRDARGIAVSVPALVLDDRLADLHRLDLIKIDIEGMEPLALRGLERSVTRFLPVLLSEFHPWAIERATAGDPVDYLRRLRQWYPAITILHRDGRRQRCIEAEAVMQVWQEENQRAGLGDRLHLDLLLSRDG
jgi:FkbM family methyltransferase